jgi:succinate-semialdehyde dehydrogenase/glutarate-semialdehyde dehydrogenase
MVRSEMLINGEWVGANGRAKFTVQSPATEELVAELPMATESDLENALQAASKAFDEWKHSSGWQRNTLLKNIASRIRAKSEHIAKVLSSEEGKPFKEALAEVRSSADYFEWYGAQSLNIHSRLYKGHISGETLLVEKNPVGPVAAFTAWNFPAVLPARKIAAALAAGCSVVLKPAEEAPLTAIALAEACVEAGLPRGLLNVVTGDPSFISSYLISSDVIRKVSLTGSVRVGKLVMELCAKHLKPITLELGGHAPAIVLADADLTSAARVITTGKFRNSGQVCIAISKVYIETLVKDSFLEHLLDQVGSLKPGWSNEDYDFGPLLNRARVDAMKKLVEDAVAKGAKVIMGGKEPTAQKGYWFEPTILIDVTKDADLFKDEPFGPILPIMTFDNVEEVVEHSNSSAYGLAGYIFGTDIDRCVEVGRKLQVGVVGINNVLVATAEAPFGGVKNSGFGSEGGVEGLEEFLISKTYSILGGK